MICIWTSFAKKDGCWRALMVLEEVVQGLFERLAGFELLGMGAVGSVTGLPSSKSFKLTFVLKCFIEGRGTFAVL